MVTLTWDISAPAFLIREQTAHRVDRPVEPLRHLAVGGFERTRAGHGVIELAGKARAVVAERVDLRRQSRFVTESLAAALGRGIERIERQRQAPACRLDRIGVAHAPVSASV